MRRRQKNEGRYSSGPRNTIDMSAYGDVPLNQLHPGRVVTAHIAFKDDPSRSKSRPAVVARVRGRTITVFPIYTAQRPWRAEIDHHGRRCYVDLQPTTIDRIDLVALDPIDIDPTVLEMLLAKLDTADEER